MPKLKSDGLRFFYEDHDVQHTAWVMFQNDFFTEILSLHPQLATRFNITYIAAQLTITTIKR